MNPDDTSAVIVLMLGVLALVAFVRDGLRG